MADVDRLKCLDEGSEHSNCLLIKLIKLVMINHSGLETVLGGLPTTAPSKKAKCLPMHLGKAQFWNVVFQLPSGCEVGNQTPDNQGLLPTGLPGCQAAHGKACCIQRHSQFWWPVDP